MKSTLTAGEQREFNLMKAKIEDTINRIADMEKKIATLLRTHYAKQEE